MEDNLFEQVLIDTLEQFTFQFADVRDRPAIEEFSEEMFLVSRVSFASDKHRGFLQLCMPVPLGLEITVSVMGAMSEDEVTDELVVDAMKECANIIAGSFTAARFGVEEVFTISHPEAHLCQPDALFALFDGCNDCAYLQVDDYILLGGYGLDV